MLLVVRSLNISSKGNGELNQQHCGGCGVVVNYHKVRPGGCDHYMWGDGTPIHLGTLKVSINSYLFWLVLCHAFIDIGHDPIVSPLMPVQHPGAIVKDVAQSAKCISVGLS